MLKLMDDLLNLHPEPLCGGKVQLLMVSCIKMQIINIIKSWVPVHSQLDMDQILHTVTEKLSAL
jgi:hypothetical protein